MDVEKLRADIASLRYSNAKRRSLLAEVRAWNDEARRTLRGYGVSVEEETTQ